MIAGWFTYVKNDVIHVQAYSQLGCMPSSTPNTCIRSVVVQITPPNTEDKLIVSWGMWAPTQSTQNIVIHDSTGKDVNIAPSKYKTDTYLRGQYQVAKNGNTLVVKPVGATASDPALAVSVTIGEYLLAVTLPTSEHHKGKTNGLMGYFSGSKDYSTVFKNRNGTPSKITKQSLCQGGVGSCGWSSQQKKEVVNWAITHVVSNDNPPISFPSKVENTQVNSYGQRKLHSIEDDFSPLPRVNKAIVLPSHMPKITPVEIAFCKRILKGVNPKRMKTQMNSCLQDAESPYVARSIAKVNVVAKIQQKQAKKLLVKAIIQKKLEQKKLEQKKLEQKNHIDEEDEHDE